MRRTGAFLDFIVLHEYHYDVLQRCVILLSLSFELIGRLPLRGGFPPQSAASRVLHTMKTGATWAAVLSFISCASWAILSCSGEEEKVLDRVKAYE